MRFKDSQDALTEAGSVSRSMIRMTQPGMMYFAGTGPAARSCGDCSHWVAIKGSTTKHRCQLYAEATRDGKRQVPSGTPSCKYFAQREPVHTGNVPLQERR